MRCPSGSELATYFAATTPPAPSRFSTITGTPRLADILSATTRAMVSEAAPGVTPETRRMVFDGKPCAFKLPEIIVARIQTTSLLTTVSSCFRQAELLRQPVG